MLISQLRNAGALTGTYYVQLINLICWIVPNAYIMARFLHCPWLSRVASIAGSVRWVMWNCTLLLYLINGTSLLAWNPKTGTALLMLLLSTCSFLHEQGSYGVCPLHSHLPYQSRLISLRLYHSAPSGNLIAAGSPAMF